MAVWQVTSAPVSEPLTLTELRTWLRLPASLTTEDGLITELITEARVFVERHTARALITQTVTEYFDCFPVASRPSAGLFDGRLIKLYVAPVISITSITYIPTDGTPAAYSGTLSASNYFLDNVSGLNSNTSSRITLKKSETWPDIESYANAVKVIYLAGYGAASDVPGPLKKAIYRLVGRWFYGRKGNDEEDFKAVADLLRLYVVSKQ
jgi:uncharacterized phiE125 gp8 family phage protein